MVIREPASDHVMRHAPHRHNMSALPVAYKRYLWLISQVPKFKPGTSGRVESFAIQLM